MAENRDTKTSKKPSEDISGPVRQKHRLRLGEANGESNPYGTGEPSKVSTISNGGNKGW